MLFYKNKKLGDIFPKNIEYEISKISDCNVDLLTYYEFEIIEKSCYKRKKEFISGRILAKTLLNRLGIDGVSILTGKFREPLWPDGIVGSISHCDDFCFVAVAKRENFLSIGVDIEPAKEIPIDIENIVLTENEKRWIKSKKQKGSLIPWSKVIFSAKESAYKCVFPILKTFINFQEVEIKFQNYTNCFKIDILKNNNKIILIKKLFRMESAFIINDGFVSTFSILYNQG